MISPLPRPLVGGSAAALATLLAAALPQFASPALAAPPPYGQAVSSADAAARAVLARAGRESCLRGKLTRALLGLSNSCEASGNRNALCALADRAVVVTPMSLAFMDDTSRQLLELIHPTAASLPAAASARPVSEAGVGGEP